MKNTQQELKCVEASGDLGYSTASYTASDDQGTIVAMFRSVCCRNSLGDMRGMNLALPFKCLVLVFSYT